MTHKWFSIAKAEFRVQTSNQKGRRVPMMAALVVFGVLWAIFIAPFVMGFVLTEIFHLPTSILAILMPGLLRAGLMFIWFVLIVFPLANALKEMKTGQWEILLSSNASGRDIFLGSFLGKLPVNSLIVLYLSPLLVSPFAQALDISLVGQALIYCVLALHAICAMWLSDFMVALLQVKLGESERGKDLAGALAIIVGIIVILPFVGFQLFASQMLYLLGLDVFLMFPFAWGADLMTGIAVAFAGNESSILYVSGLGFDMMTNIIILVGYTTALLSIALYTANRLFTLNTSVRTRKGSMISKEGSLTRAVRRTGRASWIILLTVMKDFSRKAQNLTRVGQMIGMAIFLPIIIAVLMSNRSVPIEFNMILLMVSLAFALLSGQTFGAAGFLESKHQLWIFQSVPDGAKIYAKARLMQATIILIGAATIPVTVLSLLTNLTLQESAVLFFVPLLVGVGSALIAIGVTASNPVYEDANSAILKANTGRFMGITLVSLLSYTVVDLVLGIVFNLRDLTQLIYQNELLYTLLMFGPLPLIGTLVFIRGIRTFSRLE
ncbi:MAG: hypothetical protein ACFFEF_06600 [Candidatus Thorarchaeota archaeon]